ncbi:MAG TPA: hypothetical protein VMP11_08310 [Verrucomicrobiae bacterium]|nr:hypothetical protein [Verrucomicrobiae bacterium]
MGYDVGMMFFDKMVQGSPLEVGEGAALVGDRSGGEAEKNKKSQNEPEPWQGAVFGNYLGGRWLEKVVVGFLYTFWGKTNPRKPKTNPS